MIKKIIKFEDFDGKTVEETHYFHLSMAEIVEAEANGNALLTRIKAIQDPKVTPAQTINIFSEIVVMAWGERDKDHPSSFIKSEEGRKRFKTSLALDAFLKEIIDGSGEGVVDFIAGILPKNLLEDERIKEAIEEANNIALPAIENAKPEEPKAPSTSEENAELTKEEQNLLSGLKRPRDRQGNLLAWAFRKPTKKELAAMDQSQRIDVAYREKNGWVPVAS